MFDPTKQVELMSEISYSVSPGTATDISVANSKVSNNYYTLYWCSALSLKDGNTLFFVAILRQSQTY